MPTLAPPVSHRPEHSPVDVDRTKSSSATRRSPNTTDTRLPGWASLTITVVYSVLGVLALLWTAAFWQALGSATSAPQEAAVGAVFSTMFIAGYVLARCAEKTVRALARR